MTSAWDQIPRQDGRRFVVTGANSGVGLETARALAAAGAHVVLACRNAEKGAEAARSIAGDVVVEPLDLSDLSSVDAFALKAGEVDVLVNNAGIMGVPFSRSANGVELQFATNHLGHFALTNLLLARLTDRVVVVSSIAHRRAALDLDDLDWSRRPYAGFAAYAQSKLANLIFLAELRWTLSSPRRCGRARRSSAK